MDVGILGSGDAGRSLAEGFLRTGHRVVVGTRNPKKKELEEWRSGPGKRATVGTFADAAAHGEVLVLCTLGAAVENAIDLAGPGTFDGKVVIDVTNPLDFSKGMPPGLFVGTTDSLGERIQRKLPKAKVVKAFNIASHGTMVRPEMKEGAPDMLIAGNDEGAKRTVSKLLTGLGWSEAIDVGGIDGARWLEAIVPLWVRAGMKLGNWKIAWRLLRE